MDKNCNCVVSWNYNLNMNEKLIQTMYVLLWVTWNVVLFLLSYILKNIRNTFIKIIIKSDIFQRKKTARWDEPNVSGTVQIFPKFWDKSGWKKNSHWDLDLVEIWKKTEHFCSDIDSSEQGRITFYQCTGCKLGLERGYFLSSTMPCK